MARKNEEKWAEKGKREQRVFPIFCNLITKGDRSFFAHNINQIFNKNKEAEIAEIAFENWETRPWKTAECT